VKDSVAMSSGRRGGLSLLVACLLGVEFATLVVASIAVWFSGLSSAACLSACDFVTPYWLTIGYFIGGAALLGATWVFCLLFARDDRLSRWAPIVGSIVLVVSAVVVFHVILAIYSAGA
jgi:hypothetical protein